MIWLLFALMLGTMLVGVPILDLLTITPGK